MNMKTMWVAAAALLALSASAQKLSPAAMMLTQEAKTAASTGSDVKQLVGAFVEISDPAAIDALRRAGVNVRGEYDGFVTADIPMSKLSAVAEIDGVEFVQTGNKVDLKLLNARASSKADIVQTNRNGDLPQAYTGNGVVIGVIDTGLEYNHTDFRVNGQDDQLRLVRVWDQNKWGRTPEKFSYGAEYKTYAEIKQASYDTAQEYHASHVTGIAAGGDWRSEYYGVAGDAEIVFVSFGSEDTSIPDAVQYIFDYADEVGKPCVINMSLGQHLGPHDGTSYLDRYLDSVTGPGRIVVGACGNEGMINLHCSKQFTDTDNQLKTMLDNTKVVAVDVWGSVGSEFEVSVAIIDAIRGRVSAQSEWLSSSGGTLTKSFAKDATGADAVVKMAANGNNYNGRQNVYLMVNTTAIADTRKVAIFVRGNAGDEVHLWNVGGAEFIKGSLTGYTGGDEYYSVGEIGGSGKSTISVGSYDTSKFFPVYFDPGYAYALDDETVGYAITKDHISAFSSHGPTLDGRLKPDVLAPGAMITSAVNKHYTNWADKSAFATQRTTDSNNTNYYYGINLGTSMASPYVAGTVALWLEAYPDLTPDQIRGVLATTSTRDELTGTDPNYFGGYGRLNAYEGIKHILNNLAGIENIEADNDDAIRLWKSGNTINVVAPNQATVQAYNASGAMVGSWTVAEGAHTIDASRLGRGLYIFKVQTSGAARTFKVVY